MRLRNSRGSELLDHLGELFMLHPRARSLRIAVVGCAVIIIVVIFFFAVDLVFLFVFFLGWLLSKEDIGSYRI